MDDIAPTALQLSLQACSTSMGAASGSATVPARERAGSPAGSRDPECPKNALRDPKTEANLAPPLKTVHLVQHPGGCAAPTALQPSLQARSTSMGAASGSATVPARERAGSLAGSRDPECLKNALRDPKTEANLAPPLKIADCISPPSGRAVPTALQLSANLQPPLRLPPSPSIDIAALHTPPPFNHASCKSRGLSVSVEEPAPELIALADGCDTDNNARQLTPSLIITRDPRRAWDRFAVALVLLDDWSEPDSFIWRLRNSLLVAPPARAACQGRRHRRARRGRGCRTGVVLEEAEDDDDVPVTVDDDDDVEVDDLA